MDVKENNKMIAEFLGYKNTTPTDKDFDIYENKDGKLLEAMSMQYHSDWNWLMPVVEKIRTIPGMDFMINGDHSKVVLIKNVSVKGFKKIETLESGSMQSIYKTAVKFIKWYNEHGS